MRGRLIILPAMLRPVGLNVNRNGSHLFSAGSSHKAAFLGPTQRLEPDTAPAIGSVRRTADSGLMPPAAIRS